MIAANPKCPLCRRAITAPDLRQGITAADADAQEVAAEAAAAAALGAKSGELEEGTGEAAEQVVVSESKLQALLKEVRWRKSCVGIKCRLQKASTGAVWTRAECR